ncbi:MAG: LacI family DNA-binding transcriptional regulator [Clostridia bacterium]|nr:LacI family DNA-binding transcriptional regulator [Clostridia bacterium]
MKHLKITTAEIAKICGVSQGTVDRALNNRPDIKAQTKLKILDVAKQYGYRDEIPDSTKAHRGLVGIVVFNLNNEYFSDLITELEYVLDAENLSTVVMMSHYDKMREAECIRTLYNMGVQGIIICPVNSGLEFENYLRLFDLPIVCVGNRLSGFPYVGIDDFAAMRDMTLDCLGEDYENIIYFSPALAYPDASAQRLRYEGFLSAVGDRKYSVVTDIAEIEEHYSEKTLVICSNDYYALKVYFKGTNAKITGFDNIKTVSKYNLPINTVGYSVSEAAKYVTDIVTWKSKDCAIIKHSLIK